MALQKNPPLTVVIERVVLDRRTTDHVEWNTASDRGTRPDISGPQATSVTASVPHGRYTCTYTVD